MATARINAVSKRSKVLEYPLTISAGVEHLQSLSTALAAVGESVRLSIERATEIGDAGTTDIFNEISRALDKQL